jgi:DNA primase
MKKHTKVTQSDYANFVKEDLKNYLVAYIDANGIKFQGQGRGKFQCPNGAAHKNGDRNFSAGFTDKYSNMEWKCFTCHIHGDIYSLANVLHGLPLEGIDFFLETVPAVAEAIAYQYDEDKYYRSLEESLPKGVNSDTIKENKKIIKKIEEIIQIRKNPKYIDERYNRLNYSSELKQKLSDTFDIFFPEKGDFKFLPDHHPLSENKEDIRDHIAWGNKIAFPVHNRYGKLVGIKSRRLNRDIEEGKSKYYHVSLDNEARINFFNIHRASPEIKKQKIVYIFEADFDCMVAYCYGLTNSISTGVTPDIPTLISILRYCDVHEVILILDPDKAGEDATVRIATGLVKNGFPCTVFPLPEDKDADEYIIERNSVDDFREPANRLTIPEFMINSNYGLLSNPEVSDNAKYLEAINIVTQFSRNIATAEFYARLISKRFGIKSLEDVHYDIVRQMKSKKDPVVVQCNTIIEENLSQIIEEPDIEQKLIKIEGLVSEVRNTFSSFLMGSTIEEQKDLDSLLIQGDEVGRRIIRTGYKQMDSAIRLSPGCLAVLSARPSVGKSTFVRSLIRPVIELNENIIIIHHSLDDTRVDTMDGLVSNLAQVPIGVIEEGTYNETELLRIEESHKIIRDWWGKSYYLYGQEQIKTVDHIISTVARAKRRNPEAQILLIIDNMMNLAEIQSVSAAGQKRIIVENVIGRIQIATQEHQISSLVFVELRRDDRQRPTIDMIKETGSIEYKAKIIGLMHNDYKINPKSQLYWVDDSGVKQPVVEMYFPKFKTGAPNRYIFMKANFAYNYMEEASEAEAEKYRRIIEKEIGIKKRSKDEDDDDEEDSLF